MDDWGGTSFFNHVVVASFYQIASVFGEPEYDGDKTNFNWMRYTPRNIPFTIYDYKLGFKPSKHQMIEFHIGARTEEESFSATLFVKKMLL